MNTRNDFNKIDDLKENEFFQVNVYDKNWNFIENIYVGGEYLFFVAKSVTHYGDYYSQNNKYYKLMGKV